jgi:spermidine/putrescine transport system substrate-binding protein
MPNTELRPSNLPPRARRSRTWRCPLVALLLLLVTTPQQGFATPPQTLVLLTWEEYLDPEIVADFTRTTGIVVKQVYFEDDAARDKLLADTDGHGIDLVCINEVALATYVDAGRLARITPGKIPNRKYIAARWLAAYPAARDYAVPYFWGSLGIAYRRDLVHEPVTSWRQFFEPVAELRGKLAGIENPRDLVGMALKALGYSVNTTDSAQLSAAEALLMAQKPAMHSYDITVVTADSALLSGAVVAALMYSSDALQLQQKQADIVYVLPPEGGSLWLDLLAIMAHTKHQAAAEAFLDYLNRPQIAARNALFVQSATANEAAEASLPKAFRENPAIYPTPEVLQKSEFYRDLPPRTLKSYNEIAARVVRKN